ncbi:uncharacterized protein B0I36DRAFT_407314 [Microdochium trichocladiopsis]|uniref:Uncharacterized protein n=1 Tax=Microdochium trichocladiopsis TaxID=1682393 RepID=A0A9P8Y8P4_9PEZI|nr:uncharacterized protein B0I36DRAFT_407314 [Microdochium trichocladiopsis]KAH7032751.1 hypothetical protein B0I36DRAFT_407314 [Microdochium trichocladiopsis]
MTPSATKNGDSSASSSSSSCSCCRRRRCRGPTCRQTVTLRPMMPWPPTPISRGAGSSVLCCCFCCGCGVSGLRTWLDVGLDVVGGGGGGEEEEEEEGERLRLRECRTGLVVGESSRFPEAWICTVNICAWWWSSCLSQVNCFSRFPAAVADDDGDDDAAAGGVECADGWCSDSGSEVAGRVEIKVMCVAQFPVLLCPTTGFSAVMSGLLWKMREPEKGTVSVRLLLCRTAAAAGGGSPPSLSNFDSTSQSSSVRPGDNGGDGGKYVLLARGVLGCCSGAASFRVVPCVDGGGGLRTTRAPPSDALGVLQLLPHIFPVFLTSLLIVPGNTDGGRGYGV